MPLIQKTKLVIFQIISQKQNHKILAITKNKNKIIQTIARAIKKMKNYKIRNNLFQLKIIQHNILR